MEQSGERFFLEFPYLNADCFQVFTNQFSDTFSQSLNLIVLDKGRFHQAEVLEIPDNRHYNDLHFVVVS